MKNSTGNSRLPLGKEKKDENLPQKKFFNRPWRDAARSAQPAAGFPQWLRAANLVIGLACLFFGVGTILRACSRKYAIEDKLEELDERNQLVQLKSLSKSFQLTRWISFAMMLAFLVMGKLSGEMSFIGMAVGIALVFPVSLFVEMGTFLYYESKE